MCTTMCKTLCTAMCRTLCQCKTICTTMCKTLCTTMCRTLCQCKTMWTNVFTTVCRTMCTSRCTTRCCWIRDQSCREIPEWKLCRCVFVCLWVAGDAEKPSTHWFFRANFRCPNKQFWGQEIPVSSGDSSPPIMVPLEMDFLARLRIRLFFGVMDSTPMIMEGSCCWCSFLKAYYTFSLRDSYQCKAPTSTVIQQCVNPTNQNASWRWPGGLEVIHVIILHVCCVVCLLFVVVHIMKI